jgi:hypothetical protein
MILGYFKFIFAFSYFSLLPTGFKKNNLFASAGVREIKIK